MACANINYPDTVPACGDNTNALLGKLLQKTNECCAGGSGLTDAELRATPVPVDVGDVQLVVSDLEIGAVEIKDGTSDNRAAVSAAGAVKVDGSAVTQPVSFSAGSATVSTKTPLTASAPTFATVGVASAQAVAASATRKGLHLVNTSSNIISIAFGAAAVLNSGITLTPEAGYWMDEYSFHVGAVNAIAAVAGSNLAIQEYTT